MEPIERVATVTERTRPRRELPLRVGLVGCGNVALRDHAPTYMRLLELFCVVAAADPTPERLAMARELLGLSAADAYTDPAGLLARDDVEIVDVCTPQRFRRDIVMAAAASGKDILSEKPLATTPRDAAAMVAATRSAGVKLGVVHNYLFFPEMARALQILRSGELGMVEVAILNYLGVIDFPGNPAYRPAWRHEAALAGGGVLTDMLHVVYLAEAFLGRPLECVSAYIDAREEGASVEGIALCRYETDRNAALVNVGWGVGPGGIEVSAREGRLAIRYRDGGTGPFVPFEELAVHGPAGRRSEPVVADWEGAFADLVTDFALAVTEDREPIAPGEQGLHILEATLAAYASGALGRTIELPLAPGDPVYERGVAGLAELDLPAGSPVRRHRLFGVG